MGPQRELQVSRTLVKRVPKTSHKLDTVHLTSERSLLGSARAVRDGGLLVNTYHVGLGLAVVSLLKLASRRLEANRQGLCDLARNTGHLVCSIALDCQ